MKHAIKTVLATLAGAALVIASAVVLAPKAVHAVVATLIQDTDNPARHVWAASCNETNPASPDVARCSIVVPANEEVVIQNVSYNANGSIVSGSYFSFVLEYVTAGQPTFWQPLPLAPVPGLGGPGTQEARTTNLYADPSTTIQCVLEGNATGGSQVSGACYLTGYYVINP